MRSMTEDDLKNLLTGAVLYGSGGGGPRAMGELMMQKILSLPTPPQVADIGDVGETDYAAIVAGVGSPGAATDFDPSVAGEALKALEQSLGISIAYVMAAEIGAGNSFMPLYVAGSLSTGGRTLRALNVAGSDRAVPAITMSTFAAADVPVDRLMVANHDHRVGLEVQMASAASGPMRAIISDPAFGQVAGLAIWPMTGATVKKFAIPGTYDLAIDLGRAWSAVAAPEAKLATVCQHMGAELLGTGTLSEVTSATAGGFDMGRTVVELDAGARLILINKNENLIAWRSDRPQPIAIGPDLISFMAMADGTPFSNAEAAGQTGNRVAVIAAPASSYMRQPGIVDVFQSALSQVGYPGPSLPLAKLNVPQATG